MLVAEDIVEQTWQEVGRYSEDRIMREMQIFISEQPDLLTFVATFTEELSRDAVELGVYILFVMYRMFHKSASKELQHIKADTIIKQYESNADYMESLEHADSLFFERAAQVQIAKQPHVMKYLTEALMEPSEEDPIQLNDEEIGTLFLVLKTAIDVMDKAMIA